MGSFQVFRLLARNCSKSPFGSLRVNGLYRITCHLPTMSGALGLSVPTSVPDMQVKAFCTSALRSTQSDAKKTGHNHVLHWTAEKALTIAMLGTIPAAFIIQTPSVEYLLALMLSLHSHWGIEAIVLDYVRPSVFGTVIPKLSLAAVYVLSSLTFGGLCYFIYTDVGLVNVVKMLWKL